MKLAALATLSFAAAALAAPPARGAEPRRHVLVVCSPGSPGTTAEAQPTMDAFAAALSAKARLSPPLAAVYDAAEDAGVARLRQDDAALALVSLPFFLKHEKDLGLRARLQPVPKGRPSAERWTLVAKKGNAPAPAALDGFTVASVAGFAPGFVRGPALGGWGPLPTTARRACPPGQGGRAPRRRPGGRARVAAVRLRAGGGDAVAAAAAGHPQIGRAHV